jgi:ABC-type multidrug transport system fused ATPase/permease subunit
LISRKTCSEIARRARELDFSVQYVGHSAVMDLRNQVYSRLIQQPMGFFQNNPVGRVMSAVINDIEQMRSAFSEYLADFFRQVFTFVALFSVLLYLNWKLAIGSVFLFPWSSTRSENSARKFAAPPNAAAPASPTSARSCRKPSVATAW